MSSKFLKEGGLPFCKGCGHSHVTNSTEKAFEKCGYKPLDVILVTDIGCHGIVDKNFKTHTIHGLHGRSIALASGVSAGLLSEDKKVVVFIGDGGATIGMQHIIDAAHNNFNMTVVVHNNMLYGMTGGQPSEFTPRGFKTQTVPQGAIHQGYDICELATAAGAAYVSRIIGSGDISDQLAVAFQKKGFSLVEVIEICPSYGVSLNPGLKLTKFVEEANIQLKVYVDKDKEPKIMNYRQETESLFNSSIPIIKKYDSNLFEPISVQISGSAGEGVQAAAELFAKSAMTAGLNATKKGSYPVTVGIGFSSSEIIISPDKILYTGSEHPNFVIVTSQDGLEYAEKIIRKMTSGQLFIDSSLIVPDTKAQITEFDFRQKLKARNSSLYSMFYFLNFTKIFPIEALIESFNESKLSSKIDLNKLLNFSIE